MGFWRQSWTWEDLQAIEQVRGVLMSPGVRFVPRDGGPTIFWTFRPREVIGALRGAGAPVEEADQPLVRRLFGAHQLRVNSPPDLAIGSAIPRREFGGGIERLASSNTGESWQLLLQRLVDA